MVSNGGGNGDSLTPAISADGSTVVFSSSASDLSSLPTNFSFNIFARKLTSGTTTLVSVNSAGTAGGGSYNPVISADGKVVAFDSFASNLTSSGALSGDYTRNGVVDAADYVIWRKTLGTTVNANSGADGSGNGSVGPEDYGVWRSHFGQATVSDTNTIDDVFARNLTTGVTTLVSVNSAGTGGGNDISYKPAISADGNFVAFNSMASNLSLSDTNSTSDVFLRNLTTNTTTLVSKNLAGTGGGNGGSYNPAISADGSLVAFLSYANSLVSAGDYNGEKDVFVRSLASGVTTNLTIGVAGMTFDVGRRNLWARARRD